MAARPPRPRAEADSGRERHGDPWRRCGTWKESGEGVRAFVDEKACFELASPREQLAECCEENRAGQGDPGGEAAGGRRRPGAPLRSQPGPQAAGPGRGLESRCGGVGGGGGGTGSWALSPVLRPRAARDRAGSATPAERPKMQGRGLERLQAEKVPEGGLQTPA